ncbi:MAG: hypothetical protein ACE5IR_08400 [bacterium]
MSTQIVLNLNQREFRRLQRERLGLKTQAAAAEFFGVSRTYYTLWENGHEIGEPLRKKMNDAFFSAFPEFQFQKAA